MVPIRVVEFECRSTLLCTPDEVADSIVSAVESADLGLAPQTSGMEWSILAEPSIRLSTRP